MRELTQDEVVEALRLLLEPPGRPEPPTWGSRPPARPVRPGIEVDRDLAFGLGTLAWVAALFVDSPEQRAGDLPFVLVFMAATVGAWVATRRHR